MLVLNEKQLNSITNLMEEFESISSKYYWMSEEIRHTITNDNSENNDLPKIFEIISKYMSDLICFRILDPTVSISPKLEQHALQEKNSYIEDDEVLRKQLIDTIIDANSNLIFYIGQAHALTTTNFSTIRDVWKISRIVRSLLPIIQSLESKKIIKNNKN